MWRQVRDQTTTLEQYIQPLESKWHSSVFKESNCSHTWAVLKDRSCLRQKYILAWELQIRGWFDHFKQAEVLNGSWRLQTFHSQRQPSENFKWIRTWSRRSLRWNSNSFERGCWKEPRQEQRLCFQSALYRCLRSWWKVRELDWFKIDERLPK